MRVTSFRIGLVGVLLALLWAIWARKDTPRFEASDCWFEAAAVCGHLVVSEKRGGWRSAELRLPVVRFKPQAADAPADPILFINGGPGGASGLDPETIFGWAYQIERTPWMRKREMILMDLRGTGLATPSLNCPEIDAQRFRIAYELYDDSETAWREVEAASNACRDRLLAEGRDLGAYNSAAAAQDIAELRKVLQIDALNIYGASYGTRVALILMRDHADGLRSVMLESVLPTDADLILQQQGGLQRVVEQVAADCAADPSCAGRYPDLARRFAERIESLDRQPLPISILDPVSHRQVSIPVTGVALQELLIHTLYGSDSLRFMPTFLNRLIVADAAELRDWIQSDLWAWYGADFISEGAYYAFTCAEQVPFSDWYEVEEEAARYPAYNANSVVGSQDFVICENWPIPAIERRQRQPVISAIPTLLLSGSLDPVTPPAFATQAAAQLLRAYEFVLPNAGHGPLGHSPCANAIAEAFLDQPSARPQAACLADAPKPASIAGGNLPD